MHDIVEINAPQRPLPPQPEIDRFLHQMLFWMRWAAIAVLLLLTILQPSDSRMDLPTWAFVLLFAFYNVLVSLIQMRWPASYTLARLAVADLVVTSLMYAIGGEAGGPLFVLFFLGVDSAAASMSSRGIVLYVGAVAAIDTLITVTFPDWSLTGSAIRMLAAELIILGLVASGMAILTQRLLLEHQRTLVGRDEAERLEIVGQLRTDFMATVSHELRTPLTAARSALRLIEVSAADRLRTDERALMDNGLRNIERLDLLISDLLVFNQLEAGILRLDQEELDLRDVVRDAVSSVTPLIHDKDQSMTFVMPGPLEVEGDRRWLEQAITNLIVNAHAHTLAGTRISILGHLEENEVWLAVSDDGPGIDAAKHQVIFERFQRGTPSSGISVSGSGLGLAIVRGIVQLHGGRVWVDSTPGSGATFSIAVPRAGVTEAEDADDADREETI